MIEVKKLLKRYGLKTILRELDFNVQPGEFVALLGPNGSGKTTFLRILASLSRPTQGVIRVAGFRLPDQAADVRAHVGVVSHEPLLYGDLTAEENLRFFGRMYGVAGLEKRISEVLHLVGLEIHRLELLRTFSRGMQQRLAIGRSVLHDPEVLLLDEPYTGLDPKASGMLDSLLQFIGGQGRTIVMTSHDLVRAEVLATRFDIMSQGTIVASSSRRNLRKNSLIKFYNKAVAV